MNASENDIKSLIDTQQKDGIIFVLYASWLCNLELYIRVQDDLMES